MHSSIASGILLSMELFAHAGEVHESSSESISHLLGSVIPFVLATLIIIGLLALIIKKLSKSSDKEVK